MLCIIDWVTMVESTLLEKTCCRMLKRPLKYK